MKEVLLALSWLGMASNITGAYLQSKHRFKTAVQFFLGACTLSVGIQVYYHVWSQAIVQLVFLCLGVKTLLRFRKDQA